MKLHLPSTLRRALLTCIAAFPAFLAPTLAIGALVAGAFCSFTLAADEDDDEESWTWEAPGNIEWGKDSLQAGTGSGNANSPGNNDLAEAEHTAFTVSGGSRHYKFTGGAVGGSLLLDHSPGFGNPVHLYFEACNIENLWLWNGSASIGNQRNYFMITGTTGLDNLKNIYVSRTGLCLGQYDDGSSEAQQALSLNSNFILGGLEGAAAIFGSVLTVSHRDVTTSGYLEVAADAKMTFIFSDSKLSVSQLKGSYALELNSNASDAGATLTLRDGGATYSGLLKFSGNQKLILALGDDTSESVELQVSGLGGTAGANIQAVGDTAATITIIGDDVANNAATGIVLGSGVTLALAENATQSLTNFEGLLGSSVVLGSGSTLTLDGSIQVAGSLTAQSGSNLVFASRDLTFAVSGVVDLSASGVSLTGTNERLTMEYTTDHAAQLKLNDVTAAYLTEKSVFNFVTLEGLASNITWELLDLSAIAEANRAGVSESIKSLFEVLFATSDWDWVLDENTGVVTLTVTEYRELGNNLLWDESDNGNVWSNADSDSWLDADNSSQEMPFVSGLGQSVTFDGQGASISVEAGVQVDTMTVKSGDWEFTTEGLFTFTSLTIEGGNVVLNVSDAVQPGSIFIASGSSLTLASTELSGRSSAGLKLTSSVEIAEEASLVLKGWSFQEDSTRGGGAISGSGYLVLDGCTGLTTRSLQVDVLANLTGFTGTVVLRNGTYLHHGFPNYGNALNGTYFMNLTVESGAYLYFINTNGAHYTKNEGKDQVLTVSGKGSVLEDGTDSGVIYVVNGRDVAWRFVLAGDALTNVAVNQTLGLTGEYDASSLAEQGESFTFSKTGAGTLELKGDFTTKASTAGAFDVQEGTLSFTFTDTAALANYSVSLAEDGTLSISTQTDAYQLQQLGGSGSVTGTGTIALTNTDTADTAAIFQGSVVADVEIQLASGGYWKLADGTEVLGTLAANGTVEYTDGSGSVATLTGSGSLLLSGGELTLTTADGFSGAISVAVGATLTLDGSSTTTITGSGSSLAGTVSVGSGATLSVNTTGATSGTVLLVSGATLDLNGSTVSDMTVSMQGGGTLQNMGSFTGLIIVDDMGTATSAFDVQNLDCSYTFNLSSGSYVENLGSDITLTGASTICLSPEGNLTADDAFLRGTADALTVTAGAGFEKLEIDATNILDVVAKGQNQEFTYFIFNAKVENLLDLISLNAAALVYLAVEDNEDGSLTFRYKSAMEGDVFASSDPENADAEGNVVLDSYDSLDGYTGTIINRETRVDLTGDELDPDSDGLVMRNVVGTTSGSLDIVGKNDGKNRSLVTIQNTCTDQELEDYASENNLGGLALDNSFTIASDVNVDSADLQIKHMAMGNNHLLNSRTVMTGDLTIENGTLYMTSGELELCGNANVEAVHFAGEDSQLIVNATSASVSSLSRSETSADYDKEGTEHAEHVRIENEGELVLKDGATVDANLVIGQADDSFGGTVTIAEGSQGTQISSQSRLAGVVLNLEGDLAIVEAITYDLTPGGNAAQNIEWMLAGITGSGALSGEMNMDITVRGSDRTYSGDMSAYSGTMTFGASEYEQIFAGVVGSENWNVVSTGGARITFDLMANGVNTLTMGDLTLESGSITTILLDLTASPRRRGIDVAGALTIKSGADVTIGHYQGTITLDGEDGDELVLGVIKSNDSTVAGDVQWHLKGVRNAGQVFVDDSDGNVSLKVRLDNHNRYLDVANNVNSVTGARMLWTLGETESYGGDLAAVDAAVLDMVQEGTAAGRAQANRVLAAVAGSSLATVSHAASADLERQLRAMRNRASGMMTHAPQNQSLNMDMWVNAESNYYKQSSSGLLPGVKLNGWGGTVGLHIKQDESLSMGLALTAMYNDLTTDGADRLKGDLDTYYLSVFAQMSEGAWRHTFIGSIGQVDVDATRTVDYGSGSYRTKMDTSGMAVGLMYEAGYSIAMNAEASTCLQPIFTVAWRYAQLDAYREKGGTASLMVGEQRQNTVTLGLGARLQSLLDESLLNRKSFVETRALLKADLGDRGGEANVALLKVERPAGKVRGAERGTVGLELGAGITISAGNQSDVFIDLGAELRSRESNINATIGYKASF